MPERFSERLRDLAKGVWEAQHGHPFVRGIGDGSLAPERFRHWVRQDYLFLADYARVLSMAAARAPDLESMGRFAELARETLATEMSLHRAYALEMGIGPEELEGATKAPTCQAYTDFLVRTAAWGSYPELVAALLPCFWGYSEIGERLASRGTPPVALYARWVEMYAAAGFAELARWCRGVVDAVAEGLPRAEQERMERAFLTSSLYEHLFWEMAWRLEEWPV